MNENVLTMDALVRRTRRLQEDGKRVVLTNGCFDLLHVGHVRLLRQARSLGDALVVAVNSDASVRALKGPGRPVMPEGWRTEIIAALESVDYVTVFDDVTAGAVVARARPDVYVKGGDYADGRRAVPEAQVVAMYGGLVVFLDIVPGASSTGIIESILANERRGLIAAGRLALST